VLIFTTLGNVFTLNNLSSSAQQVARGVIIVAAVLLQQRFAGPENRLRLGRGAFSLGRFGPGGPAGAPAGTAPGTASPDTPRT
jgi:ribose transport system permease protein